MLKFNTRKTETMQTVQMAELCREKLIGYSESLRELARSFQDPFEEKGGSRQNLLEERRIWENRRVICSNLNGVAQIMERVAREELQYEAFGKREEKMIVRALREEGFLAGCLCRLPCDNDRTALGMTLQTLHGEQRETAEVANILSVLLRRQIEASAGSSCIVEEETHSFCFLEQANYIVLTGFARAVRENEAVSGDNYAFFETETGKMSVLLSDGTGSGEKARRDSERVLDLMEKMMGAGYESKAAAGMVNEALFVREEDGNHPTLDICNLDLYGGSCEFMKVGGAMSFLKRGESVDIIRSGSLPLGIFRNIEVPVTSRTLQSGDYLIMMTDGVLDAFGEEAYEELLVQTIGGIREQNPQEIAEYLLHFAICRSQGHINDDMTILVAGVWENGKRQVETDR